MHDNTVEIESRSGLLHYINDAGGDFIRSFGGDIWGNLDGNSFSVNVGSTFLNLISRIRIVSRLLRIHRINVLRISKERILIIYRNNVYVYELQSKALINVHRFKLTHYVHTQSISVHEERIVIGEYGNIGKHKCVGGLVSLDGGQSWSYKALFEQGHVKNILAIRFDKYNRHYWVFTGDDENESGIYLFDEEFKLQKIIGKGLSFRAISSFHLKDKVVWLTNNPFGLSTVQIYDRVTGKITEGLSLPGPVWYACQLGANVYCCTAAEDAPNEAGKHVYLLHSYDYLHWEILRTFKKDCMNKKLFLYGLGTFPRMAKENSSFYLNMDAVKHFDGYVIKLPHHSGPKHLLQ